MMLTQAVQFIAWWIALAQFITGLYALYLQPRYGANRHISAFLIALAISTFAVGSLAVQTTGINAATYSGSGYSAAAENTAMLIAAVAPLLAPLFLLASIWLIHPQALARTNRDWTIRRREARTTLLSGLRIGLYVVCILPVALTLIDRSFATGLWYTGLEASSFMGRNSLVYGSLTLADFSGGKLETLVLLLNFRLPSLATGIYLLYSGIIDKRLSRPRRLIAWALLAAFVFANLATFYPAPLSELIGGVAYLLAFAYAIFLQAAPFTATALNGAGPFALSPTAPTTLRKRGRDLRTRLTVLILIVTLPLLAAMGIFLTEQARGQLEQDAVESLSYANQSVSKSTALWLDYNEKALQNLAANPNIISMDPARQVPLLEQMAVTYPQMYLISTTDLSGKNVARNDGQPAKDYSDRKWYQDAAAGAPVTYQTLQGRTSGQPAIVVSIPIRQPQTGEIVGVAMFASDLDEVSALVSPTRGNNLSTNGGEGEASTKATQAGADTQQVYIVDQDNLLVAHPDPAQTAELKDLSDYPPVQLLRQGQTGAVRFIDEAKQVWRAEISLLPNGWAIIAQVKEADLFAPIAAFQRLSLIILVTGTGLLFIFAWLTIRQGLRPIQTLTKTATAITAGDLSSEAAIESDDELGVLAVTMNAMTKQLAESIGGLENRVAERTRELERRVVQIQVAADVAREAAALVGGMASTASGGGVASATSPRGQLGQLLDDVVNLISERFGHYHAGIFLCVRSGTFESPISIEGWRARPFDELSPVPGAAPGLQMGERDLSASDDLGDAVLYAASSEGGKRMLARGHRLKVGQEGMVGYVAATGQPRIALDVGQDAVYFDNPDLQQTRSEIALPLMIGGGGAGERVIGVLDVQSKRPSAFSMEDAAILQILADQVALAIQNARLLSESQQALRELQRLYGMQTRQAWLRRLSDQPLAYSLSAGEFRPGSPRPVSDQASAEQDGEKRLEPLANAISASGDRPQSEGEEEIEVPIELRGQRLGRLHLKRSSVTSGDQEQKVGEGWSVQEKKLLQESMAQLALSLENARLLEEVQNRAAQETLINQIVARAQSSLNLETVMKTAVQEVGRALKVARVELRLQGSGKTEAQQAKALTQQRDQDE